MSSETSLKIEDIDFQWVEGCEDVKKLKLALRLLKRDPFPYEELTMEINEKILKLDEKAAARKRANDTVNNPALLKSLKEELNSWESLMEKKEERFKQEIKNKGPAKKNIPPVRGTKIEEVDNKDKQIKGAAENVKYVKESVSAEALALQEKNKGNDFFRSGDIEEALKCYNRALKYFPEPVVYSNRAMANLKIKKFSEAENDCSKAIQLGIKDMKVYWRRGSARKMLKKYEAAINDFQEALKYKPKVVVIEKALAECKRLLMQSSTKVKNEPREMKNKKENFKRIAIEEVDSDEESNDEEVVHKEDLEINSSKIIKEVVTLPYDEDLVNKSEQLKEEGKNLFLKGDHVKAIEKFSSAIDNLLEKNVDSVEPYLGFVCVYLANRALCHQQTGNYLKTLDDCTSALDYIERTFKSNSFKPFVKDSLKVKCLLRRAFAYEAMEKPELALLDANHILRIDFNNENASKLTSRLRNSAKMHVTVIIQEAKQKGNTLLTKKGDINGALECYTRGLRWCKAEFTSGLCDSDGKNQLTFSELQLKTNDQIGVRDKKLIVQVLCNRGLCFIKNQKFDAAIKDLETVLKFDNNNMKALYRKGLALYNLKRPKEALIDLEKADSIQTSPECSILIDKIKEELKQMKDVKKCAAAQEEKGSLTKKEEKVNSNEKDLLIQNPKSFDEFDSTMRMIKGNPKLVFNFIKLLDPSVLKEFLSGEGNLTAEHLISIAESVKENISESSESETKQVLNILLAISEVPRFSLVLMMASEVANDVDAACNKLENKFKGKGNDKLERSIEIVKSRFCS